ncbi:YlxR family protein [uncultured Actinomyces sp.]|uniref:YlxR family protein n=1 Tax=uncultured Actinomyces sp. TaxID=249061 RepID=UPI00288BF726|nr:YlxR family protein [uncultured Actinomyces sp.]
MATTSHVPVRTCIGCRVRAPRAQLLRLVNDDGRLAVDARAVAPGRGAWIHPDPTCLELAERRRALGRALRVSGPLDAAPVREWFDSFRGRPPAHADRSRSGAGKTDCEGG